MVYVGGVGSSRSQNNSVVDLGVSVVELAVAIVVLDIFADVECFVRFFARSLRGAPVRALRSERVSPS